MWSYGTGGTTEGNGNTIWSCVTDATSPAMKRGMVSETLWLLLLPLEEELEVVAVGVVLVLVLVLERSSVGMNNTPISKLCIKRVDSFLTNLPHAAADMLAEVMHALDEAYVG